MVWGAPRGHCSLTFDSLPVPSMAEGGSGLLPRLGGVRWVNGGPGADASHDTLGVQPMRGPLGCPGPPRSPFPAPSAGVSQGVLPSG